MKAAWDELDKAQAQLEQANERLKTDVGKMKDKKAALITLGKELGGAVQVDPRLTPGCPQADPACFQRLKVRYDKLLSDVAFNFNLRPSSLRSATSG